MMNLLTLVDMKIVCKVTTNRGRPPKQEIKELKERLTNFYNSDFQPLIQQDENLDYTHMNTVLDYLGGVRSTCAYINAHKIKHMSKCVTFVVVSQQINTHLVN